jgi:membrane fusion protein, heavy metal efflux system
MSMEASKMGKIGLSAVVILATAVVWSRRGVSPGARTAPGGEAPDGARAGLVAVASAAQAKNPVVTGRVTRTKLSSDLNVVGSVTYDQDHFAVVGPLVSGRVVRVDASVGDPVRAGQVLAVLESPEVGQAQAAYLSATARAGAARSNAARESDLAAQHISSAREKETAEVAAASEAAEVRASLERLRAFGLGSGDVAALQQGVSSGGRVPLRSPIDGTVVGREVTLGQAVERSTDAFRVANLARLWVLLDLYEKDLPRVHVGQNVEIKTDAAPGEVFSAKVTYVTPLVDERTRTASARIELHQRDGRLLPGQFVTARLLAEAGAGAVEVVAVPRRAVQSVEGKPVVFRRSGQGFEKRAVELGASSGDLVEVKGGLAEGDEVALDGAFLLKSELLR